jgi:hypothetical protein
MLEEWVTDLLTDEEIKGFHDLGTSPIAAWISPFGRVVLEDDSDGRARIHGPEVAIGQLVELALGNLAVVQIDLDAEKASGPIPEPDDVEGLRELLSLAHYAGFGITGRFWGNSDAAEALEPVVEVYIARRIPTIGLDEARRLWRDLKLAHPRLAAYALSGLYRRTATRA